MAMAVYMLGFNTYMGFGDKICGELGEDKDGMLERIYEYAKKLQKQKYHIDIYEDLVSQGERYYLDGLYNCAEALHQYYKSIRTTGTQNSASLKSAVLSHRTVFYI